MHEAAKRGNYDMIKECLKNNVKKLKLFHNFARLTLIETKKVSTHSLDKAGNTPLHWAAYGGHVDCAKILLESSKLVINLQVRFKF
jgi:ankyrin repeat protein